jgi:hypothetical protein
MGKGSARRPRLIDRKQYESNWDSVFKRQERDEISDETKKQAVEKLNLQELRVVKGRLSK